jgi:hypothetical protein
MGDDANSAKEAPSTSNRTTISPDLSTKMDKAAPAQGTAEPARTDFTIIYERKCECYCCHLKGLPQTAQVLQYSDGKIDIQWVK